MTAGQLFKYLLFIAFLPVALPVWLLGMLLALVFGLLFNFTATLDKPILRDHRDGSFRWNGKIR